MKVYYLSITSFSDVDMGIMHHLKNDVQLTYGVVIQKRNANFKEEELQTYCSQHGIRMEAYKMQYNLKDPRTLGTFQKVIANIKKLNPDVIYIVTFDNIYLNLLSVLLDKYKTIIALHDVEFHSNTQYMQVLKASRAITMRHFNHFQVFSKAQLQRFKELYPHKSIRLIPLPLKDFGNILAAGEKATAIQFLFFGNILFYKGLDLLLEAVNALQNESGIPPFELVIAGRSDDWETTYEPLIKNKALVKKHIRFIGNDEIAPFFSLADYVVLPYRDATQSGPLKIAFNYNKPVIASDIDSFREEIKDGVDGYLFKSGDVVALKETLKKALLQHDTEYQELQKAQWNYVQSNYSAEKVRNDFLEMFQSVHQS